LKAGDRLLNVNGDIVVVEWIQHEIFENPIAIYNFEVKDYHTYFIADGINAPVQEFVLVHNKDCGFNSKSFHVDGEVGPYNNIRVDVESVGSGRYSMHLQYKSGPGSPAKLPFDTSINKFVGLGADVFNGSSKVRNAVISASKYIKGVGGVLHWRA
jgi:hypothetical protein